MGAIDKGKRLIGTYLVRAGLTLLGFGSEGGRAAPFEMGDDEDDDDAPLPRGIAPATLSDEARRMVVDGLAPSPKREEPVKEAPLKGSFAERRARKA